MGEGGGTAVGVGDLDTVVEDFGTVTHEWVGGEEAEDELIDGGSGGDGELGGDAGDGVEVVVGDGLSSDDDEVAVLGGGVGLARVVPGEDGVVGAFGDDSEGGEVVELDALLGLEILDGADDAKLAARSRASRRWSVLRRAKLRTVVVTSLASRAIEDSGKTKPETPASPVMWA